MPKRIVDGDALWTSDKLALLRPEHQAEYPYLIPLAFANGTFLCDSRLVWRTAYSYNRPHITPDMVEAMLTDFVSAKMLFRWKGEDGKLWGFWVGINKTGRLPRASRQDHEKRGLDVPEALLEEFLSLDAGGIPVATQGDTNGSLMDGSPALGLGLGKGKGLGSGPILADGKSKSASLLSSSLEGAPPPSPPPVSAAERVAGAEPPVTPTEEQEEISPVPTSIPARKKTAVERVAEQKASKPKSPVSSSSKAPVPSDEEFSPLDFVFTLPKDGEWEGISVSRLRRVIWYHFRVDPKKYWLKDGNLTSEARLVQAIATMDSQVKTIEEQTQKPVHLPGWTTSRITEADPSCATCSGTGVIVRDHPDYPERMHFKQTVDCSCLSVVEKPWRREYKED